MKNFILVSLISLATTHALSDVTPDCKKTIYQAVLKKAKRVNPTASVDGHVVVYGQDKWNPAASDVVIVLASDETESSHYAVVVKKENSGACKVLFNDVTADGSLPPVKGLND